jgi:hypothetical protein
MAPCSITASILTALYVCVGLPAGAVITASGGRSAEGRLKMAATKAPAKAMPRALIRYDDGTEEWLLDSEPGLSPLPVGRRDYMTKAALCASVGWYTVVRVEDGDDA